MSAERLFFGGNKITGFFVQNASRMQIFPYGFDFLNSKMLHCYR
jgi:hypothetical protein